MTEIKSRIELPKLLMEFGLPLTGVEVGVAGASNATDLLKAGLEKIYLVDAWKPINVRGDGSFPEKFHNTNYQTMLDNLSQFDGGRYVILQGLSSEMCKYIPDNFVGLVYIDGDHYEKSVREDIENYYPKLVAGGIIGFHDFENVGYSVNKVVKEFASNNNLEIHYIPETGIGDAGCWLKKTL